MSFDDQAFLIVIAAWVYVAIALFILASAVSISILAIHKWLQNRQAKQISAIAWHCRKLGLSVELALAAAKQTAEKNGFEPEGDFSEWFEKQFKRSVWQKESLLDAYKAVIGRLQ